MNAPWSLRGFARRWQEFFFTPADPLPCDVLRIAYAGLVLASCLICSGQMRMFYGESGVVPFELSRKLIDPDTWTLFSHLPHTDGVTTVCYALMTLQAALLLVGVWSRVQAVCVYLWLISFHHRNLLILDSEDCVFRMLGFLLICMPLGSRLSFDAWWRRRRQPNTAVAARPLWALRLVQLEICLVFAGCALTKLQSADWLDGTALYYVSRLDDMFGRFWTPASLWESMTLMKWLGWSVIALEAVVPVLIWFRETRLLAIGLAALFDLATDYCMNLYLFHWIMLAAWSSFVTADDWRWVTTRCASWLRSWRTSAEKSAVPVEGNRRFVVG